MSAVPPAVIGGSRVLCPYRDEAGARHAWCRWHKRLASRRALRAYRRHWLRAHA